MTFIGLQIFWQLLKPKKDTGEVVYVPDKHIGVIYQNRRALMTTNKPAVRIFPKKGQSVVLVDLRQRFVPFNHIVETRDRAQLRIQGTITWQISEAGRYLDRIATKSETNSDEAASNVAKEIIESTIKAALLTKFGQSSYRELAGSLDEISINALKAAFEYLIYFGIFTSKLQIFNFELTASASARQEVERLRALDLAVKEIEGRTLDHVEKLANSNNPELKLHINKDSD